MTTRIPVQAQRRHDSQQCGEQCPVCAVWEQAADQASEREPRHRNDFLTVQDYPEPS